MKYIVMCLITYLIILRPVWSNETREISLDEVLHLAEINSPRLTASEFQEIAAEKGVEIARSKYFPTLKLDSIYDNGLPGSSGSALDIQGMMASPYRSGPSVGVVAKQLVYDFGRTDHAVKASQYQAEASKQDTKITIYEVKTLALKKYYECALFRTQRDLWGYLGDESNTITKEVHHFVDTGQRSVVERYLSKIQTEEAYGFQAYYAERLKQSVNELAIMMGVASRHFSCPSLSKLSTGSLNANIGTGLEANPFLRRAILEASVASEKLKQEKSELFPEISLAASTGYLSKTRFVKKQNYAIGIGMTIPIFDLNISGKIKRAEAVIAEKHARIEAERQTLAEWNARYDEIIKSTAVLLKKMDNELQVGHKGFEIAKKRYFSLEGDLVDLREAFRNLSRIRSAMEEMRAQFLQASGAKALLNGTGETLNECQ